MRGFQIIETRCASLTHSNRRSLDCPACPALSQVLELDSPRSGPVLDFYVRTWQGDGHWLIFMLRSIEAHVPRSIYRNIIITYNRKEDGFFRSYLPLIPLPLVLVPEDDIYFRGGPNNGSYYSQMYSKFFPWKHSDAEYFIHIDSDCVFTSPINMTDFIDHQGRVYVKNSSFALLKPDHRVWQAPAEALLKESVPFETMTGFPFIYPRDTYQNLINHVENVHGKRFLDALKSMEDFNEFTPLGHFLMTHMPGKWVTNDRKSDKCKQQWSWSGLTPGAAAACEVAIRS